MAIGKSADNFELGFDELLKGIQDQSMVVCKDNAGPFHKNLPMVKLGASTYVQQE
jgi:hypothetical protein